MRPLAHGYAFPKRHGGVHAAEQRAVRRENPEPYDSLARVVTPLLQLLSEAGVSKAERLYLALVDLLRTGWWSWSRSGFRHAAVG